MCGIVGALDLKGSRAFPRERLEAMTRAIAHRGPDDEHFYTAPGIAMALRRLAIMDVLHGRQPVANETGDIWSSFNGQLFNYPALRQTLLTRGHQLTTQCDAELWPHLYEEYGEAVLQHARGQIAVAIWDEKERALLLGRDQLGICPLYYAERDGWLLWASEIKALFASGLVDPVPDRKGIDYLFTFYCAGNQRTYFEGVHLLPAGHYIRVKQGRMALQRYWDLQFPHQGDELRLQDPAPLVEEFDGLFSAAVARRLQSDVPVVSYLSGGVDSAMILSAGNRLSPSALPAFTISLDQKIGTDEKSEARQTADLLGSRLTTLSLDCGMLERSFPELIIASEGPVLDTSCAALMQLAAEVNQQGYKVALTGEGADEALAGYFWFKTQKISNTIRNWIGAKTMTHARRGLQKFIYNGARHGSPDLDNAFYGVRPAQQYIYEIARLTRESLYSDDMWAALRDHNAYEDVGVFHADFQQWHPLNQSLYVGYKLMLPGLLLMSKGDRIAMRSAVETRYPFLDLELVEFCARLDPAYKLRRLKEKWLLRQVAAKSLPPQIANRPKTMFRSVLSEIFLGPNRPAWVDQLLSPESLRRTGYFNAEAVARERHLQRKHPRLHPRLYIFDAAITCVITTQLWHHLFCGGNLCDLPVWQPLK